MTPAVEATFGAEALGRLRRRAEQAAAAGRDTFAIPEAAPAAECVAAMAPAGPLRIEAEAWLRSGARYHELVRLAARAVIAFSSGAPAGEAVYLPKARGDLEPMLRLWPSVLAVPTTIAFSPLDLVTLRAFPVHPLGVANEPTWADGRLCSPAEYFFHDLDHARYKVREDLRVEGIEIPDAYQDGTTVDPRTGQHRVILTAAEGRIGATLWERAEPRRVLIHRLLTFVSGLAGARATAAELLLFEIVNEKSHPADVAALDRELASDAHLAKIRRKQVSGFYGARSPTPATMAALDEARQALRGAL